MHIKRLTSPRNWKIRKREAKFVVCPNPGPHPKKKCIPLAVLVRDILGLVDNYKEAKVMIKQRKILVDGKARKAENYGVGLMDPVIIGDRTYRVVPSKFGLKIIEIPSKESGLKLVKIANRGSYGKKLQLQLHDGRTMLTTDKKLEVGDSLLISVPDNKIQKHLPLKPGVDVLITDGKHSGTIAKFTKRMKLGFNPESAVLEKAGEKFETLLKYLMVVGEIKVNE
jgi:small subunit ribosomal protein S4e